MYKTSDGSTSSNAEDLTGNNTNTSPYVYLAEYDFPINNENYIIQFLGNNGKITIPTTSLTVDKTWVDDNLSHIADSVSIKLNLYKSEEDRLSDTKMLEDTITLNNDNNWQYTWTGLPMYTGSSLVRAVYTVEELPKNGYAVGYEQPTFNETTNSWSVAHVTNYRAYTQLEYYLADDSGNPIDQNGNSISFDNRVIICNKTVNGKVDITSSTQTVIDAQDYMTGEWTQNYGLVDQTSSYTVKAGVVSDSTNNGSHTVTGTGTVASEITDNHLDSLVSFAVTKCSINPDAVVVDYGKSIIIDVLDNDLESSHKTALSLNSIGTGVASDVTLGTSATTENKLTGKVEKGSALTTDNAKVQIVSQSGYDYDVVKYTLKKYLSEIDRFYYAAYDTATASYLYQKVSVIPATTVYYEDNFGGDSGMYISYTGAWQTVNNSGTKTDITSSTSAGSVLNPDDNQDSGLVGTQGDRYGYDTSYDNDGKFSNGTASVVTGSITKNDDGTKSFNAYAEFDFTGTGFDIISRTDLQCGLIGVYITDANGTYVDNVPVINKGTNTLYQIPVISYTGLTYGTYHVKINVSAPSTVFGYGGVFYLDAIRIFDPLGTSSTDNADFNEGNEAYNTDNEANAEVTSIRDMLINNSILDATESDPDNYTKGVVWVDTSDNTFASGGNLNPQDLKNYTQVGPNEEVYLTNGNAVGFVLSTDKIPSSIQIAAKAPYSATTLNIYQNGSTNVYTKAINSGAEMYYDVTNYITMTYDETTGRYRALIMIYNGSTDTTANDILSLTNIKVSYSDDDVASASTFYSANLDTYSNVYNTVNNCILASTPSYKVESVETDDSVYSKGESMTLTVATSKFVDKLVIKNSAGKVITPTSSSYVVDEEAAVSTGYESAKVWTIVIPAPSSDDTYYVVPLDSDGNAMTDGKASFSVDINEYTSESSGKGILYDLIQSFLIKFLNAIFGLS